MNGSVRLADVALPIPLPRALSYLVPDKLALTVTPGRRVLCTLGSRRIVGVVLGVREGEKAAFRWVMGGTHLGEFLGMAPTGRRVEAMGTDIVHTSGGEIVAHWGEFDAVGLLRRLGAIRPPESVP